MRRYLGGSLVRRGGLAILGWLTNLLPHPLSQLIAALALVVVELTISRYNRGRTADRHPNVSADGADKATKLRSVTQPAPLAGEPRSERAPGEGLSR
jgi:hypothetical protein